MVIEESRGEAGGGLNEKKGAEDRQLGGLNEKRRVFK